MTLTRALVFMSAFLFSSAALAQTGLDIVTVSSNQHGGQTYTLSIQIL